MENQYHPRQGGNQSPAAEQKSSKKHIWLGLLFAAIGLVFLLDGLGVSVLNGKGDARSDYLKILYFATAVLFFALAVIRFLVPQFKKGGALCITFYMVGAILLISGVVHIGGGDNHWSRWVCAGVGVVFVGFALLQQFKNK